MFVLGTNRFGTIALSCPALMLLMTHHEKNTAENFTVALTLTLGGYESAIAPIILLFFIQGFTFSASLL